MHVLLTASILIFSSLAGCLGTVDDEDRSKGTVLVSTYHVEQIVSAIAGDTLNVERLSPSNVPVHDYEPSATDLVRLQDADLFFYHGLGLETWIDATMDSLGDDAPPSFSTHAMPNGQTALDYEGMLVDQLCNSLSSPGTTDIHILAESVYFADEIHSDNAAHNLAMPEDDHHDDHDDDHDDHGDDDHDDHGDDDHDEHDDHEHANHEMVRAEETLTASSDCPTGTTISVYELEAGEYMLEFEAEDMEAFTIAIAAMGGAHHHHHDHGDEHDDDGDDHGDDQDGHDDHWDSETCHDEDTHETHEEYTTEEDCEAAGHMWMEAEHDMDADEMIEMFDTDSDGFLSLNEFLTMAEEMEDDDLDHDHSDDDAGNDSDDGHDDHDEHDPVHEIEMAMFEIMFHMADMNEDENLSGDELDRLINAMEGDLPIDGEEMAEIYFDVFDEDENDFLTVDEFSEMMEMMMSEEDDHDDHAHDENETHDEDDNENMTAMMFTMYDADQDGNISIEEFSEVMEMMGGEHEDGVAFIGLHVEEEGDYGFALPAGVKLHILSMGGHDGHDHGSHGEGEMVCYNMSVHMVDPELTTEEDCEAAGLMWTENQRPEVEDEGTHDEEDHQDEDGHDDHGDEEALAYDPHSWLDPLAYKAQVALVLGEMKTAFPDLADTFQTNADAFMASLDEVDADYNEAFGPNGTCTNNTVASNHNAYSYMAYRYNLEFVTVHGIDPEGEPSAADIAEVIEAIEEDAITVLFVEEYTDETAVNSIVDQTNGAVTVQTLYTMELPPKDSSDDYLSLMEKNLNSLKAGLGC